MLKGWTLTDLHCDQCRSTPLMREPASQAAASGRPPTQFCAQCDGRPDDFPEPAVEQTPALTPESQTTPPQHHAATHRADPDAAADAISELLLKGYSLLGTNCPDPDCAGIPLVGHPRRKDGSRDPRRECVSCGTRYIDEKDVESSGLRIQQQQQQQEQQHHQREQQKQQTPSSWRGQQAAPVGLLFSSAAAPAHTGHSTEEGGESPRSRMRREMYEQGAALNEALAQKKKEAEEHGSNPRNEQLIGPIEPEDEQLIGPIEPQSEPLVGTASASRRRSSSRTLPYGRPFVAADHRPTDADGRFRVVLISSGSVASVKIPNIVNKLKTSPNVDVQVVATKASLHFFDKAAVEREGTRVWEDADEWSDWKKIGDPILHIELRRWADFIVVVPTSADMLAKLAGGICDSLATSLLRATPTTTPVILCPAMNTVMYEHPLTARQEAFVRAVLGYYILGPQNGGKLACGDVGSGKMTEWTEIADAILGAGDAFQAAGSDTAKLTAAIRKGTVKGLPELEPVDESLLRVELPQRTVFEASWKEAGKEKTAPPVTSTRHRHHHEHKEHSHDQYQDHGHHKPASTPTPDSGRSARAARNAGPSAFATFVEPFVRVVRVAMLPLLLALHFVFTLGSVILRLFQSSPPSLPELEKPAPAHVALVLVPGKGERRVVAERYVESVRRAVQWAADWGTPVLSVWDGEGYGVRHAGVISASLLRLPPSPPSSDDDERFELHSVRGTRGDGTIDMGESSVHETVYVNTASGPRTVNVVFLPPSAGEVVARVTKRYAHSGLDPDAVTQATLDADIKEDLGLPSDPDLVVVHHLTPPGFFRGLLPRPAPELHGFPAWTLRISEIYHHPPTLPFYVPFIGGLLQNSPLAIFRKLGQVFPSRDEAGILDEQTWEGAQNAWERVEQRRGK